MDQEDGMEERIVERTIYLNLGLDERLKKVLTEYTGLNFNLIVNQALEEWLRGPQCLNSQKNSFIFDVSKGFGPTS
jgi:hypothetical protein